MSGFDCKTCWVAPRAGVVHGPQPSIIFTMQKLLLTGSDIFFTVNEVRSDDLGKTWLPPLEHATTLGRRQEPNGIEEVKISQNEASSRNADTVYDPQQRTWTATITRLHRSGSRE
ncbi:MAG: hypothetical protein ACKV2Q_13115 [Planctomycetaceae bacterium]